MASVIRFYRNPGLSSSATGVKSGIINKAAAPATVKALTTESCFYVEIQSKLSDPELLHLRWILSNVLNRNSLTDVSKLPINTDERSILIEIGPR